MTSARFMKMLSHAENPRCHTIKTTGYEIAEECPSVKSSVQRLIQRLLSKKSFDIEFLAGESN